MKLEGVTGEETGEVAAAPTSETSMTPTEAAASLLPLGAGIGPAGLAVMPYSLTFNGTFFHLADFLHGLDNMVQTKNDASVTVDGRLLTINGFSLKGDQTTGFPDLEGSFSVTAFVTPPSSESPESTGGEVVGETAEAAPASTTTGGAAQ